MRTMIKRMRTGTLWIGLASMGGIAPGQSTTSSVVGAASAKGIVVLKGTCEFRGELDYVRLGVNSDGTGYKEATVGVSQKWRALTSVSHDGNTMLLLMPVVWTSAQTGMAEFLFARAGVYELRWGIHFVDAPYGGAGIDQIVTVGPPRPADEKFIAHVSDPRFLNDLFGRDRFERYPQEARDWVLAPEGADFRALMVIEELLKATRESYVGDAVRGRGSVEELKRWAEVLLPLAKELEDSSYAPYCAYYAGCSYAVLALTRAQEIMQAERRPDEPVDSIADGLRRRELLSQDPHSSLSREAFAFAARRGDAYLKPRSLYQRAWVAGFWGREDEVQELLDQALAAAPGEGTIHDWVTKLRRDQ